MSYSQSDLVLLNKLSDAKLETEIEGAKEELDLVQEEFKRLEESYKEECGLLNPSLDILFSNITNIENYIRKAENLIHGWDGRKRRKKFVKAVKAQKVVPSIIRPFKLNRVKSISL